jgi:hypothetical protein
VEKKRKNPRENWANSNLLPRLLSSPPHVKIHRPSPLPGLPTSSAAPPYSPVPRSRALLAAAPWTRSPTTRPSTLTSPPQAPQEILIPTHHCRNQHHRGPSRRFPTATAFVAAAGGLAGRGNPSSAAFSSQQIFPTGFRCGCFIPVTPFLPQPRFLADAADGLAG